MDDIIHWIWFQQALKYSNRRLTDILDIYGNIKNFYHAGVSDWKSYGLFDMKQLNLLSNFSLDYAYKILNKCKYLGYDIVTFSQERYPKLLKNISNPPSVLYVRGTFPDFNNKLAISFVGTRAATNYGLHMAYDICRDLAGAGVIVVSGGAIGIDAASHKGTIYGGGITVSVLGCGINYPYLMQNRSLRERIAETGALISEYPPDYPVYMSNFPIRNRIIAGLSYGTVVVEAGKRSGSLITANLAVNQNRDVFVVPVDIRSPVAEGAISLIRDGAKIVTCAEDVLNEYKYLGLKFNEISHSPTDLVKADDVIAKVPRKNNNKNNKLSVNNNVQNVQNSVFKKLSENSQKIYGIFDSEHKYHIDKICILTGISIKNILPALMELEVVGLIKSYPGRMYGKNVKF